MLSFGDAHAQTDVRHVIIFTAVQTGDLGARLLFTDGIYILLYNSCLTSL